MKPTARLDRISSTKPRPTGLGQSTYELWHYVDIEKARQRVLNETPVTLAMEYVFAGASFGDAIAENAANVVNQNGGNASVVEKGYDPQSPALGKYKLCVVESESPRPDIDGLMQQFIEKAKKKPYSGATKEEALEIVFEELTSSRSKPNVELKSQNQFNPLPSYFYGTTHPVVHWKKVREGSGSGDGNGSNGNGSNGGGSGQTYRVKRLEGSPPKTVVLEAEGGFSSIQPIMDELRSGSHKMTLGFQAQGGGGGAAFFDFTGASGPTGGEVFIDLETPVPKLLQNAAQQGSLVAKVGRSEAAIPPSQVPTPGGNGGSGGPITVDGGRRKQAQIISGASNATVVIGAASLMSVTLIAAAS